MEYFFMFNAERTICIFRELPSGEDATLTPSFTFSCQLHPQTVNPAQSPATQFNSKCPG